MRQIEKINVGWHFVIVLLIILGVSGPICAQVDTTSTNKIHITGKVISKNDQEPLPGVNIIVEGTTNGTITNINGEYELKAASDDTLRFSFIGFATKQIPVNGRRIINVTLVPKTYKGQELVVVGYGKKQKRDLTGSVASISVEDMESSVTANFGQALQGRAAGVRVVQSSGVPGSTVNIRIRGISSINASSEPLYVIDGIPINTNSAQMSIGGRGAGPGILSTLNPNNIASIDILKGPAATAIYGARGANGVVLITTKRGRAGTSIVTYETYMGYQKVANKLHLLNATQFAKLVNEAAMNAGRDPVYVNPSTLREGTDWQSELFRVAPMMSQFLSFSGGSNKIRYAVSGGYFNQKGIVIGSGFRRYSFRINLDADLSEKLSIGNRLSYSRTNYNGVLTGPGKINPGVVMSALQINPILPVYNSEQPGGYTFKHDRKGGVGNPIAEAKEYVSETTNSHFMGKIFATYQILDGLKLKTDFGIDYLFTRYNSFGPKFLYSTQGSNGEAYIGVLHAMMWINQNTIHYTTDINENHHIDAFVGFTMQHFRNESLSALAFGFPDGRTGWHDLSVAQNPQNPTNDELEWSMLSYIGRVNYSYNDTYLLTLTGRVDGSSKFAEGHKYGFFPSAAFAWRISNEPFMEDVDIISNLKLRIGYGFTGNQSIPPYQSLSLVVPFGEGVWNDGLEVTPFYGRQPASYPNEDLKWETTEQINIGLDLSLFDNRISLTANVYHKITHDLLLSSPIPYTSGFGSTLLNIGNVENKGLEISLNTINSVGNLFWSTSVNFSMNRNTVTDLARDKIIFLGAGGSILKEGESIGTFYGYVFDGIYQSYDAAANGPLLVGQAPQAGIRKYKDLNGDGVINAADRTIIGSAQPNFFWGIRNEISYQNFTLSFFFQGVQGNEMANMNLVYLLSVNGKQNVLYKAWKNRWRPDNPSNKFAKPLATGRFNVFHHYLLIMHLISD